VPLLAGQRSPFVPSATVVLPQIIAEAALVPATPVTGPGTFILDDPTSGRLDVNVLGTNDIWTDISPYVLAFTTTRPSTRLQGPLIQFQAGTATITLDNSDARFDPDNLNGPYVAGGATRLTAMVPVRIRAVYAGITYPLFSGFADGWLETATDYEAGYSEVTLSATDLFKVLAGITLPPLSSALGTGELSGARITRILNSAGWYTSTDKRTIATGDTAVQGTLYGDSPLNLMQITSDSEVGWLYASPAGAVVYRNRRALTTLPASTTIQAFFGDQPGGAELPLAGIGRADDDTTLANDIQATRVGGVVQEVTDAASIAKYLFPRTYSRTDLILVADSDALTWAQWILFISKSNENRFDTVTIDPAAQPDDLWPQVLGRDMGDRIQVTKRPHAFAPATPGDLILDQVITTITDQGGTGIASESLTTTAGALVITKGEFITGISHTFDTASSAWQTVWNLTDASRYGNPVSGTGFLTLDDPVAGRLDFNALSL
jgi:hypothetical protein